MACFSAVGANHVGEMYGFVLDGFVLVVGAGFCNPAFISASVGAILLHRNISHILARADGPIKRDGEGGPAARVASQH